MEEESESEKSESKEDDIPEEEDKINFGYFSSNLEGYLDRKGKSGKEDEEENSEENTEKDNTGDEGNQSDIGTGEEEMEKAKEEPIAMREEE